MIKTLDDFSLIDILPDSLKNDSDVYAIAIALDPLFKEVFQKISLVTLYDNIPDSLLDIVAYGENVDFYDSNMTVEQKRQLINKADFFARKKGTPAAVEDLISTIFGEGKIIEWFEYGGDPGYFKVLTNNLTITQNEASTFLKLLNSVKRTTAWLETIEFLAVVHEDANIDLFRSGNIVVTRSVLMNGGGVNSTGIFLDGSFTLNGFRTLNNPARPGPTATSTQQITVTRAFQSAYNTRVQGPKLDGRMLLNGKWLLAGQTTDTPSITVSVTCNGQAV